MILVIVLILAFLGFAFLSGAIIYHLYRFSPEQKGAFTLITLYSVVSLILIFFVINSFLAINWQEIAF